MSRLPRQLLDGNSGGDFLQGAKALARDVTGVNAALGPVFWDLNPWPRESRHQATRFLTRMEPQLPKIPPQDQLQRCRKYIKGTTGKRSPHGKACRPCSLVLSLNFIKFFRLVKQLVARWSWSGGFRVRLPRLLEQIGGSAWESNPPTAFSRRHTGFVRTGFPCP